MTSVYKRNAALLLAISLMIFMGCSSVPAIPAENPSVGNKQSTAALEETPSFTSEPTPEPTPSPTPIPAQYPQPDPVDPESAGVKNALAAYELAAAYLSESVFLTDLYETVSLDTYLS